jgi:hypothetical protein
MTLSTRESCVCPMLSLVQEVFGMDALFALWLFRYYESMHIKLKLNSSFDVFSRIVACTLHLGCGCPDERFQSGCILIKQFVAVIKVCDTRTAAFLKRNL